MIRNIYGKKKMLVDLYFCSNTVSSTLLKELVEDALLNPFDSGINICAIVCDQASSNVRLFSLIGATANKSYFVMNERKLFIFFDPPHLLEI